MNDHVEIPELPGYVSIKEAAKTLGISDKRVYAYIDLGRLHAVRVGRSIAIPQEEIENFQRNITGRPRKSTPLWRIPPADNKLRMTSITVQILPNRKNDLLKRLEAVKTSGNHVFPGTIARYIAESETIGGLLEIELVWRGTVSTDEADIEQELEDFRRVLADVLDWDTAQYDTCRILMHT